MFYLYVLLVKKLLEQDRYARVTKKIKGQFSLSNKKLVDFNYFHCLTMKKRTKLF
jgi:hypothetical protein